LIAPNIPHLQLYWITSRMLTHPWMWGEEAVRTVCWSQALGLRENKAPGSADSGAAQRAA
jgi:hypothetical protein